jgi:hypothetical protein
MKNPFGDQQVPGSYRGLQERMYKKVSLQVSDKIAAMLQKAYEFALNEENIVLSRAERNRLFAQTIKRVMEDISKNLAGKSGSG